MASERTIKVVLRAQIDDFKRQMSAARDETKKTSAAFDADGKRIETASGRMVRSAQINRQEWQTAGMALTAFGAAGVVALGLSAKAAIEWEAAWAGVLKTVDGSHAELAQLEDDLRAMALVLPASQAEIAETAALLGQLGIKSKDIAELTRVMIDLGETTNLSAGEAATTLARFANIMGSTKDEIKRTASVIVDLGNNSATTEREIADLGLRLAAAGKQAGLTEGQVLAIAAAMSSVGIEAEAGGTAMSKVITAIADAARSGNSDLEKFAIISGKTSDEFKAIFDQDAAKAVTLFVEGLGRMSNAGQSTTEVFDELELTDQRLKRSVLSLGSANGLLTDSLDLQAQAWADNTALIEEAEKRYDTTEAKVQIAKNAINEAAISIGENLLPVIASMASGLANAAKAFSSIPEPIQRAMVGFTGVGSAVLLTAGGLLLIVPRILDTYNAFKKLNEISPGVAGGIQRTGKAMAVAGAAFTAALIAYEGINAMNKALIGDAPGIGRTTKALLELAQGAESIDAAFADADWNGNQNKLITFLTGNKIALESYDDTLAAALYSQKSFWQQLGEGPNSFSKTEQDQALQFFGAIDTTLTNLVSSGSAEQAKEALDRLGIPLAEQAKLLPQYTDALEGAEVEQAAVADSVDDLVGGFKSYNDVLTENIDLQREASGVALNEWDALTQFGEAVMTATDALYDENGALIAINQTLDQNTQAGRDNRDALSGIVDSTWAWIDAGNAAGVSVDELRARMDEGRRSFINTATQMGLTEDQAAALADEMGLIPSAINTTITADTSQATRAITAFRGLLSSTQFDAYSLARTRYADGGAVTGPGTGTSDSIPAMLSNGEHVWTAREVQGAGGHAAVAELRDAAVRGFATGGPVTVAASPVMQMTSTGSGDSGVIRLHPQDLREITHAMRVTVGIDDAAIASAADRGNLTRSALGEN